MNIKTHKTTVAEAPGPVNDAVMQLHKVLRDYYGDNCSYVVCGNGELLAAKTPYAGREPVGTKLDLYIG